MLMKSLQIVGPQQARIIETEVPVVQDHQVLVEIEVVATCPRWDMNMMAGRDMFNYSQFPVYPLGVVLDWR